MNEIRIIISPDRQTVEVVTPQEDGTMDVLESITHHNLCYAVVKATEFIREINRERCVTCYNEESNDENTVGMCDTCWAAEMERVKNW